MHTIFHKLYVHLILTLLYCGSAAAADFEFSRSPLCQIELNGEILSGDKEKLKLIIEEGKARQFFRENGESTANWRMCLSSPGGSLSEAAAIAEYIYEIGIGTVIEKNQKCMSACSWIFMMGFTRGIEELNYTNRQMHYTGTLGFHAPRLDISAYENLTREQVETALSVMNKAFSRILKISNSFELHGEVVVKSDLLEKSFEYSGPNEFYLIDSVDKVGRWDIPIYGIEWPLSIDYVSGVLACNNLTRWMKSLNSRPSREISRSIEFNSRSTVENLSVLGDDSGYFEHACKLQRQVVINDYRASIRICGANGMNGTTLGDESCTGDNGYDKSKYGSYPAISIFPSDTKLKAIPAEVERISRWARAEVAELSRQKVETSKSCAISRSYANITNVQNFTNLRRQAGLGEQVIAQVPLGQPVTVVNPRSFLRYDRCASACNGTNQNAIKQCIDNNDVWIEVDYNGRRGFLSRKFLE